MARRREREPIRRHPNRPNRWQVRYRDPDGRQRSKNFARRKEAEAFLDAVRTDLRRGEYVYPFAGRQTFASYAATWKTLRENSDLKPSTLERDRDYLNLMLLTFGKRQVKTIKPTEIEVWLSTLECASSTRAKALQKLRGILELARKDGAFKVNPASDVKPPKIVYDRVGRALTDDELHAIIEAAEVVNEDQALIVWLMVRCGMRIGEATAIKRSDIDFDEGTIRIERTLTKDGRESAVKGRNRADEGRTIPMSDDVERRVRRHLAAQTVTPLDGRLVTSPRGKPIRYDNWRRRVWYGIVELAGVGDVHAHDLRHTCATRLFVVDRWTPGEVQAFLGHKDPRVTLAIYTHIDADQLPKPTPMWTLSGHLGT